MSEQETTQNTQPLENEVPRNIAQSNDDPGYGDQRQIMSENIEKITADLIKVQSELGPVSKSSVNPFFKSKYADINDIALNTIQNYVHTTNQVIRMVVLGNIMTKWLKYS